MVRILLVPLLALFFSMTPIRAAEMRVATIQQEVLIRREAKATAEVLGRYRKGVVLRVFLPARNGWYATYFATPVKGTHYGWIPEGALAITDEPRGSGGAGAAVAGSALSTWLGLAAGFAKGNQGVGTQPTFALKLNYWSSDSWNLGAFLQYTSLPTDPNISTTGLIGAAEALYYFAPTRSGFFLGALGGAAMMFLSGTIPATGTTPAIQVSGSASEIVVGPSAGFQWGNGAMRYGLQGTDLIFTGSSSINLLNVAATVQFGF